MTYKITNSADVQFSLPIGNSDCDVIIVKYPINYSESKSDKPLHQHEYYEMIVSVHNDIVLEYMNNGALISEVQTGPSIILVAPRIPHRFIGIEQSNCLKIGFSFNGKKSANMNSKIQGTLESLSVAKFKYERGVELFTGIMIESLSGSSDDRAKLSAAFTLLVYDICDQVCNSSIKHTDALSSDQTTDINYYDMIENTLLYGYKTEISIHDLSQKIYLSERQIDRLCLKKYGRPFRAQKTFFRIEQSKKLLRQTTKTVTEIAMECGFTSVNSFYRAFSKECKTSPNKWRKENNISHF